VVGAWRTIRRELKQYGAGLERKSEILALNKIDAVSAKELAEKKKLLEKAARKPVHAISGATTKNVTPLLRLLRDSVMRARAKSPVKKVVAAPPLKAAKPTRMRRE
jgi:GTP-binding protein